MAAVGAFASTTSTIHEYSVQLENGNVTFIDTPGFGDTRSLQYDAQFIASLEHYIRTHSELSSRKPDVVFLCNRYDDNRISGPSSQFVKMLKAVATVSDSWLQDARIVGVGAGSNTAVLLTHSRSKTGEDIDSRIPQYNSAIQSDTTFTPLKVLLAENKPDMRKPLLSNEKGGASSEEGGDSEQSPRAYKQDWYPANLCSWMKTVLRAPACSGLIDSLCQWPQRYPVEESSRFKLLSMDDSRTASAFRLLTKLELQIPNTTISLHLTSVAANSFTSITSKVEPPISVSSASLAYVQKALNLLRIVDLDDVPVTDTGIARMLRHINRHDDEILALLHRAFGIQPPKIVGVQKLMAGYFINGRTKEMTPSAESAFDMTQLRPSQLGYRIPSPVSCTYAAPAGNCSRGLCLDVQYRKVATAVPAGEILLEFRFMHCKVKDAVPIETTFMTELRRVASGDINTSDTRWRSFFAKYGTHVAHEAFIGGTIQMWGPQDVAEAGITTGEWIQKLSMMQTGELSMHGGNPLLHVSRASPSFGGGLLHEWIDSIQDNPLPVNMQLVPIENYLRNVDAALSAELAKARARFTNWKPEDELEACLNTTGTVRAELKTSLATGATCDSQLKASVQSQQQLLNESRAVVQKFADSESRVRELNVKLVAMEIEGNRLRDEVKSETERLAFEREENAKAQTASKLFNKLLGECSARADNLQTTLNTCTVERNTCQLRVGHHRGHGHRHGHWRRQHN